MESTTPTSPPVDAARIEALANLLADPVIEVTASLTIAVWNAAAERLYGYGAADAIGANLLMLATADGRDSHANAVRSTLAGAVAPPFEAVHVKRDGSSIAVEVTLHQAGGSSSDSCFLVIGTSQEKRPTERHSALVRALMSAQEEERRRIAYDLHDGLTQYVMASHAHLETFRYARDSGHSDRASTELDNGIKYLKEAIVESRRLVNGLRTLALDNLGLPGAIEQLLQEEKVRAGWSEAYLVNNTSQKFDKVLATAVFRVVQEALTNARKHARTERVRVMLLESPAVVSAEPALTLEVRDWGRGFDTTVDIDTAAHVGLQSMEERASLLGAQLTIQSAPGEGTVVRVAFPIGSSADRDY